ncbi:MAG: DUF423 domain-containing protein [Alphaproteobacteria bacterium]|nr:DUF423 domain-containing protein [Alphaproteobacteria bacterium]MCB9697984.1 DUF423 domain-containing protein [Alphaproteobacteria bacterium]
MWWRVAGVSGALAVMLGAFGAHGLKGWVDDPHLLEIWDKAARYHLVHAVALMGVAAHPRRPNVAGGGFVLGTLLFSGSLYAMTLTGATWLGAITPLGGLSFIAGWIALAAAPTQVSGRDH